MDAKKQVIARLFQRGLKPCFQCERVLPLDRFGMNSKTSTKLHTCCKNCASKRASARIKIRSKTDPIFRLKKNARRRAAQLLKQKVSKSSLLGCTATELREWIGARLSSSMTWDNYGTLWHLDHIVPCSAWDLTNEQHIRACFHYTNLQPMFALANCSKGGANRKDYINEVAKRLLEFV